MTSRSYFDLSNEEINKLAKLTPKEEAAVNALMEAVKALPRSIAISVHDNFHGDGNFTVSKRITECSTQHVRKLRKSSLYFGI